ncbi:MAG: acetyl-CoA carboxylase biotin carboxylase subunit [Bacteroidetes bacterium]|nr:acetyl-CoA carboxylase biotin carboxylase subunit [Bacteroidota bacterium]
MGKILIANRGEIAVRIIRSAREMGYSTVAVYSDADIDAPHVRLADEAYRLGPAPSNQSYLLGDKIIEISRQAGVWGIHPGYGFLSENYAFAQAVTDAGLVFIGPKPHAIQIMGNKLAAKAAVSAYQIPMLGGTAGAVVDVEEAKEIAEKIGYPVLIKAAAGGGGKGMRVVYESALLENEMKRAVSEALSSFGDGSVFIEKYVTSPRHIEIQVLFDSHGNGVYLFERDCSIQRRHQKVVEEAPSAVLSPSLRKAMGEAALDVGRSCDYLGAGTVEFLVDDQGKFFFLEMNTRLQVEHPVTELITGLDLVKEQIKVARGEALSFNQEDLKIYGHAIELRLYAEDPANNFLPYTGTLTRYRPSNGPGVRVDSGFEEGMTIPVHYDPMIAKLIVHGADRAEAIARMKRAIHEFQLEGIENTLSFGHFVMEHPAFISGDYNTHFVPAYFSPEKLSVVENQSDNKLIAALSAWIYESNKQGNGATTPIGPANNGAWLRRRWA